MNRFEDKVALITGAAAGIGKACCERIAAEGGRVVCTDVSPEAVEQTAKELRAAGHQALALVSDVSDPRQVADTVTRTVDEFGQLDVLANVAGILHFDNTHELSLEKWNTILAVNLTGTFLMSRAALPHLLATRGNIVNVASTAGMAGAPWMAAYGASKGGVLALTRTFAVEYGKQGLRANSISPGSVKTAMHDQFTLPEGADGSLITRMMPLDTFRGPETAAALVAFLASEDAAHVNGENVRVDGATLS